MLLQTLLETPTFFALWVVAVVFGITIHEFSHGLSARLQGDPTAEQAGRLTLNPLAHIDWVGFFLLVVAGFGWAKPTPYNPHNLKYKRFGGALVALAGPLSNIAAVIVFGIALAVIDRFALLPFDNLLVFFLQLLVMINVLLAVFNFIPIPPLDGSKMLYSLLGNRQPQLVAFLERYGVWLLLALVFLGGSWLSALFGFFYNIVLTLIY